MYEVLCYEIYKTHKHPSIDSQRVRFEQKSSSLSSALE